MHRRRNGPGAIAVALKLSAASKKSAVGFARIIPRGDECYREISARRARRKTSEVVSLKPAVASMLSLVIVAAGALPLVDGGDDG